MRSILGQLFCRISRRLSRYLWGRHQNVSEPGADRRIMSLHPFSPIPAHLLTVVAGAGVRFAGGFRVFANGIAHPACGERLPCAVGGSTAVVIRAGSDLTGEDESGSLFRSARDAMCERPAPTVLLDLRSVRRADTKLVAFLVELHRLGRKHGATIELLPSAPVFDVLKICRLECLAGPRRV